MRRPSTTSSLFATASRSSTMVCGMRSSSARILSTTRPKRLESTPKSVPTAVRRKTGAIASSISCDISPWETVNTARPGDPRPPSHNVQVIDALRDVAVLGFLGVQLDRQPQIVDAVGIAQRVLVADLADLVQVEERLVEGLHAE